MKNEKKFTRKTSHFSREIFFGFHVTKRVEKKVDSKRSEWEL